MKKGEGRFATKWVKRGVVLFYKGTAAVNIMGQEFVSSYHPR